MPRVKFKKSDQIKFLDNVRKELGINTWVKLAKVLNVYRRCLSDWSRAKYTLPEKVFKKCIKLTKGKVEIPQHKVLPDFWSTSKATKKSWETLVKKSGGIPKWICSKGGLTFAKKRRLHPERYQHCYIGRRKEIFVPAKSKELAEFFGIVLGDGGITDKQVIISLNRKEHRNYALFIFELINKLFQVRPTIYYYHSPADKNKITVTISSKNLIDFLLSNGLKKGNKVAQQVDVPKWIQNKIEFSKECLRGLIDTDGGVYYHNHKSHRHECFNIGLAFSNRSLPLLDFVRGTLLSFGFTPKFSSSKFNIHLYRESEILKYIKEIQFSNTYHSERAELFFRSKYGVG